MKIIHHLASYCYLWLPKKIQKSLQKTLLQQQQNDQIYKIEISNGEVQKIMNFDIKKNKVTLISITDIILKVSSNIFALDNLIVLILLIILLSGKSYNTDSTQKAIVFYTLACYLLDKIQHLINLLIVSYQIWQQQTQINQNECLIFQKFPDITDEEIEIMEQKNLDSLEFKPYDTIKWCQLEVGNIVCLEYGDQSPADLLILDSSLEQIMIDFDPRLPCQCTYVSTNQSSKGSIIDFITKLSGIIQFTIQDHITGSIKLKNDPKATSFSRKNMILRGEILDADWIFGIVIRAGDICINSKIINERNNLAKSEWLQNYTLEIFMVCLVLLAICFIPNIIYNSFYQDEYFFSSLTYCLLIFPQNLFFVEKLWHCILLLKNNEMSTKFSQAQQKKEKQIQKYQSKYEGDIAILSENEQKILIPVQKQFHPQIITPMNDLKVIKQKSKTLNFHGFQSLTSQSILNLIKTDIIVIENPKLLFKSSLKVVQVIHDQKTFQFNIDKLKDLVTKASPQQKTNYDKLLIDTNRQQTQDEYKQLDIEQLISEKRMPELRCALDTGSSPALQMPKLHLSRKEDGLDLRPQEQKQTNTFNKKKSSRFIFDSSFSKNKQSQLENQNQDVSSLQAAQQSSQGSLTKQKGQFIRPGTQIKHNSSSFQNSQIKLNDNQSDRLIGDCLSEQDFLETLYNKEDTAHNEILIMMLLANSITTVFNAKTRKLQYNFENQYDECILSFTQFLDYQLLCATEMDNDKPEFNMKTIVKKVVSVQNNSKVFDILASLDSTENRKNTISVLVRDPESFLLDEGSLLYTRIETNFHIDYKLNEQLQEMAWDGQKIFIYQKRQLNQIQTDDFLKKLLTIHETYGNRSHEIEKLFLELEQKNNTMFVIGIKSQISNSLLLSSNELNLDNLDSSRIFSTLYNNHFQTCFITSENYDELLIFLRSHLIVQQKDQIVLFKEKDVQQLQFKFRQHIQFILENQNNFEQQQRFIVLNQEAFQTILSDEYLKHHFIFIIQFSFGLGAYQFDDNFKGKLIKVLKLADKKITCIGNSLDNKTIFNKSDMAFSLIKQKSLVSTTFTQFLISSTKQLFKIIFFYCPNQFLNYMGLIEAQLYRSLLIGIAVLATSFSSSDIDILYLIIFYLIPSNLFSFIQQYYLFQNQIKFERKLFNNYAHLLAKLKNKSLIKQLLKTVLIAILDFTLYLLTEKSVLNLQHNDGNIDQVSQTVLLYITLELLEKSKIIFFIISSSASVLFKMSQFMITIFILSILITMFVLAQCQAENMVSFSEHFNSRNFISFLFLLVFTVGVSFVLSELLKHYNIQFSLPDDLLEYEQHKQEIKTIKKELSSSSDDNEDDKQVKFMQKKIKDLIDHIFENKDIIDESITKYIKGDQPVVDYLNKFQGFQDSKTEKDFQEFFQQQNWHRFNIAYVFLFYDLSIFVMILYDVFTITHRISVLITISVQFTLQFCICIIQFRIVNEKQQQQYLQILSFLLRFIFKLIIDFLYIRFDQSYLAFFLNFQFVLAFATNTQPRIPFFVFVAMQSIIYLVDLITNGFTIYFPSSQVLIFCLIKFGLILIEISYPILQMIQKIQFLQRSSYIYLNRLNNKQKQINNILGLLMPRFIQERMNKGQIQISQDQGDVTVLFCDIYQFDKVIKIQQEKILDFLDTLYRAFDQLCQANDIQKIETVGKTYMAAGGLKDYDVIINSKETNSTIRALETAIQMMESVKTMKYGDNQDVKLKIGVHYGRVIAGVIGMHKPQFSLIGDTVNTTSRVCSTSDAGFITLSESAYMNIKDKTKYQFEQKAVAAKGKGTLETFRLIIQQQSKSSCKVITPKTDNEIKQFVPIQTRQMKTSINQNLAKNKNQMKRASVMNPMGISLELKSPKVIFRQLQQDMIYKQPLQSIIIKKQSLEQENKEIQIKRVNTQKSKSDSQLDNDAQTQKHLKAKTPALVSTMRNSVTLTAQKRQAKAQEGLGASMQVPSLQQFTMTQFQPGIENKMLSSHLSNSSSNQQHISQVQFINSYQMLPQQNMLDHIQNEQEEKIEDQNQSKPTTIMRTQRSTLKKKGTIIIADLVPSKKSQLIKSNTKIIIQEEKDKDQDNDKGKGGKLQSDSESSVEYPQKRPMNKQKSIKVLPQDSVSVKRKSLEAERLDELEIIKRTSISRFQKKLDLQKLQNIRKFKLNNEKDYNYEGDKSQYNSNDQTLYYQIYEEYKNQELNQFRSTFCFLTLLLIFKNILYLLLTIDTKDQIKLLISILCQLLISFILAIPLFKYRDILDFQKIKIVAFIYFICINVLHIFIVYAGTQQQFEIVLQTCHIASLYINIFNQQLLTVQDKQKIQILFLILAIFVSIYEQEILNIIFFVISTLGLTFYSSHFENLLLVKNHKISLQLQAQIDKYDNMLQYLMPPHALKRLLFPEQDNTDTIMDVMENATVLFADIAGFTKYSSSVQPETVVQMLRNLFQSFDCFCQIAQVYKLFTIGDCYVCMGVLDCYNRDPSEEAQKVLVFGLKMIQIINHYNKDPQYQHLNMRIGAHTGRILGGVVGTDVVRYDIYGEDVTIANLMESSGTEGKMLVSETTKNLIESVYDDFKFDYVKNVQIPSKNTTIATYFVSLNDVMSSQDE